MGSKRKKTSNIIQGEIVGDVWLNLEELTTALAQIEPCLNSRPLTVLPQPKDGIEALTPGHFLIRPCQIHS